MTADVIALAPFLAARDAAKAPPAQVEATEAERDAICAASALVSGAIRGGKKAEKAGDRQKALRILNAAIITVTRLHDAVPCQGVLAYLQKLAAHRDLVAARQVKALRRELRA